MEMMMMIYLDEKYSEDFDASDDPDKQKNGYSSDSNGEKNKSRESSVKVRDFDTTILGLPKPKKLSMIFRFYKTFRRLPSLLLQNPKQVLHQQ
jgi:hypothetical protein